jgi:multimeric flavodoxin WrbA
MKGMRNMKKILFLTTTQTVGGNGDTLVEAAIGAAKIHGTEIERIDIRNKKVNPCFQ